MTIEQIKEVLYRKPWRPVEFTLDSGDRIVVEHPENVYISIDGSRLRVFENGDEWVTAPRKVTALRRRRK